MGKMNVPPSRWRHLWLPGAWCIGALLIWYGSTRGSFDPTAHQYGANWPGDVRRALFQLTGELFALYAILRPHSYVASWKRAALAFALFVPWTLLDGLGTMHAGRVDDYHWVWLLLLTFGLFPTVLISASVAVRHRAPAT